MGLKKSLTHFPYHNNLKIYMNKDFNFIKYFINFKNYCSFIVRRNDNHSVTIKILSKNKTLYFPRINVKNKLTFFPPLCLLHFPITLERNRIILHQKQVWDFSNKSIA